MAKVTRKLLKSLVKECLVEILIEGIDSDGAENLVEAVERKVTKPDPMIEIQKRRDKLDSVRVNEAVNSITDDPLMADIFRDTAQTTLQEQTVGEQRGKFVPADNLTSYLGLILKLVGMLLEYGTKISDVQSKLT